MIVKINPKVERVRQSATLAINQRALQMRAAGQKITHFGFGQSPFPVHPAIRSELEAHSDKKEYQPTFGLPKLRAAIAAYFSKRGYEWEAENIIVGPGSKELLFDLMLVLEGALLLPAPCWVSYHPQAQLIGKLTLPVRGDFKSGYRLSLDALEDAIEAANKAGEDQKLLLINSPSNPLGTVFADDELRALARFADKHGLFILSDEIYAQVSFDGKGMPGISAYAPERTIVTSGLSKAFSAGGYRLGFAFVPPALSEMMPALAALISETFSCVSSPIQYAACRAYSDDAEINRYLEECTRIHGMVARYVCGRLTEGGLDCLPAAGGFYLFPDFNRHAAALRARGIADSRTLCDVLLEEAGVVLLPAEDFGMPPDCFAVRLATVDYEGGAMLERLREIGEYAAKDASEGAAKDAAKSIADPNALMSAAPNVVRGCDALVNWLQRLLQKG